MVASPELVTVQFTVSVAPSFAVAGEVTEMGERSPPANAGAANASASSPEKEVDRARRGAKTAAIEARHSRRCQRMAGLLSFISVAVL